MRHTILLAVLLFSSTILHAQLWLSSEDLSAIESTTPLTLDQMPVSGTFFSAATPSFPPLPGNIFGLSGWSLGEGYYLLDDLDGSSGGGSHAMDDSGPLPPGVGEGGSAPTNSLPLFSFPTNGLWLWITNVANNTVYANLNGATDYVYEVYSKTDLMATNWDIETEVFPGANTNSMPFTIPMAGRTNLFLWARDWTGITSLGNETPEWWFYEYFGTVNLSDTDLDSAGNTLFNDYTNKISPPNLPALSLIWPQDGTPISGTSFTLQAQLAAPSMTITASIVDAEGNTNVIQGWVEQNGMAWVQNLPLATGTNRLTVIATGNSGNQTITNIIVTQSSVAISMNPLTSDQFNQQSVTVTGMVSDVTCDLYVNNVQAFVNTNGGWEATNVPVSPTDMAVFDIQAFIGDPVLESAFHNVLAQPPVVVLSSFTNLAYAFTPANYGFAIEYATESDTWSWNTGGQMVYTVPMPETSTLPIPPDDPGFAAPYFEGDQTNLNPVWEQSAITYEDDDGNYEQRTNHMTVMLVPGGGQTTNSIGNYIVLAHASEFSIPPLINPYNWWGLDANKNDVLFCLASPPWFAPADLPLPPEWLQINGQQLANTGMTNDDGSVWGAIGVQTQGTTPVDVTPTATQFHALNDYTFNMKVMNFQLTVLSNTAVQINQTTNWAAVRSDLTNDYVIVEPMLDTTNASFLNYLSTNIVWSGGSPVPGNGLQRAVSKASATNVTVTASIGSATNSLAVWVVWADLTVKISGTLDPDDQAFILVNGNWPTPTSYHVGSLSEPNGFGGGNGLGPIDCLSNPDLDYAFTVGRMEAKAILKPANIGNLITNGWKLRRTKIATCWDDGGNPVRFYPSPGTNDTSGSSAQYTNLVTGELFDLDAPGCSVDGLGTNILRTAEVYNNFYEYATVNLGNVDQTCSDTNTWSYEAQVDGDIHKVQLNSLSASFIQIPTNSYYPERF